MKTYRERFIKNHRKERQPADNGKGYKDVYVYTGDYYTWESGDGSFSAVRKLFAILEAVTVIIFIMSSIPGTLISYSPLTISGALLSAAVWAFEVIAVVRFCFKKLPLEEDDYAYIRIMFNATFIIRAVLLLFSVIAGIIYLQDKVFETASVLAIVGYFITAAIAVFLYIRYRKTARSLKIIPSEQ